MDVLRLYYAGTELLNKLKKSIKKKLKKKQTKENRVGYTERGIYFCCQENSSPFHGRGHGVEMRGEELVFSVRFVYRVGRACEVLCCMLPRVRVSTPIVNLFCLRRNKLRAKEWARTNETNTRGSLWMRVRARTLETL